VNWSINSTLLGFDFHGNPQSVWPYTIGGQLAPTEREAQPTSCAVVPVTLDYWDRMVSRSQHTARRRRGEQCSQSPDSSLIYTSGIGPSNTRSMRAVEDRTHHGSVQRMTHQTSHAQEPHGGCGYRSVPTGGYGRAGLVDSKRIRAFGGSTQCLREIFFSATCPVTTQSCRARSEIGWRRFHPDHIERSANDVVLLLTKDISNLCGQTIFTVMNLQA